MAVEETKDRREDRGQWKGHKAVAGAESYREERGPYSGQGTVEGAGRRRENRGRRGNMGRRGPCNKSTYSDNRFAIITIVAKICFFVK